MFTFEEARAIVQTSATVQAAFPNGDFEVGEYGWENEEEFRVVAGTHKDVTGEGDFSELTLDAPMIFVNKQSKAVRLEYGRQLTADPLQGMTPIGEVPSN